MMRWLSSRNVFTAFLVVVTAPALAAAAPAQDRAPQPEDRPQTQEALSSPIIMADGEPARYEPLLPTDGEAEWQSTSLQMDDLSRLSTKDLIARSTDSMANMRAGLNLVLGLMSEARKHRDQVLINCLSERVRLLRGIIAIAEEAHHALGKQVDKGDIDSARASYTRVMLAGDKASHIRSQCQGCVGVESYFYGDTQVQTLINPEIAGGDPFFGDRRLADDPRIEMVQARQVDGAPEFIRPPDASIYR